jgi:hypothetical protein
MVWALLIGVLALLFAAAFRPQPRPSKLKKPERPPPAHPWASGIAQDFDDFSGPQNPYGPGTPEDEGGPRP